MNNVCVDCLTMKNWLGLLTEDDEVGFGGLFSYIFSVHILPNDFSIPVINYGVPWSPILVFPFMFTSIRISHFSLTIWYLFFELPFIL